jgi:hypothetical protein
LIEMYGKSVELRIDFGAMGNSADYKIAGWQDSEQGFTWTLGKESSLAIPCPELPGRYALELHVSPFVWRDKLAVQRIIVTVNDEEVARFAVENDSVLRCEIPWYVLNRRAACIVEFKFPDSAKPVDITGVPDVRTLAIAFDEVRLVRLDEMPKEGAEEKSFPVEAKHNGVGKLPLGRLPAKPTTESELKALMMRFESLGEDCEFGLVQRRCGAEPLGLLRFSSTPLAKLITALEAKFEGLGRPDMINVEISSNGREYMVLDKRFGLYYHAWVLAGEKSPEEIHARECSRLPFLARKLVEDLQGGDKIFVYRGMTPLAERDVNHLASTMRTFGPTTLLWMEVADDDNEVGSVEELATGLFRGNIERFAPIQNAHDFSLDAWIEVCHNANFLKQALSAGSR